MVHPEHKKKIVFMIAVAGVIVEDNRVLFLRRRSDQEVFPGFWELPCGKREICETSYAALGREIREEIGREVLRARVFSVYEYVITYPQSGQTWDTTQINFLVELVGQHRSVRVSHEHDKARWLAAGQIRQLKNTFPEIKKLALRALKAAEKK